MFDQKKQGGSQGSRNVGARPVLLPRMKTEAVGKAGFGEMESKTTR